MTYCVQMGNFQLYLAFKQDIKKGRCYEQFQLLQKRTKLSSYFVRLEVPIVFSEKPPVPNKFQTAIKRLALSGNTEIISKYADKYPKITQWSVRAIFIRPSNSIFVSYQSFGNWTVTQHFRDPFHPFNDDINLMRTSVISLKTFKASSSMSLRYFYG